MPEAGAGADFITTQRWIRAVVAAGRGWRAERINEGGSAGRGETKNPAGGVCPEGEAPSRARLKPDEGCGEMEIRCWPEGSAGKKKTPADSNNGATDGARSARNRDDWAGEGGGPQRGAGCQHFSTGAGGDGRGK